MEKELERLLKVLHETNPISNDYSVILDRVEKLIRLKRLAGESNSPALPTLVATHFSSKELIEEPKPKKSKTEEPVHATEPEKPVEQDKPVEEETESGSTDVPENPTLEDLRAGINLLSQHGVLAKTFISRYMPEGQPPKLTKVPPERYREALLEIKQLIKENNDAK